MSVVNNMDKPLRPWCDTCNKPVSFARFLPSEEFNIPIDWLANRALYVECHGDQLVIGVYEGNKTNNWHVFENGIGVYYKDKEEALKQ